ncbi:PDZ domain-containing protein [Chitinophaga oryziterrae]|uniref:PDZ domain-containing protein n=1 Tax=Chitinophaga oryziterrae TaxID=1031224 RepID=A0A6N8JDX6_9BACT|nr:PDZ domain-containing protein [Chitinophaga oryziterrae]
MRTNRIAVAIYLMVFLLPVCALAQTIFYVSLKGSDAGNGTRQQPFLSIGKALAVARSTHGQVIIRLFGGTYYLESPVVFTAADSRSDNETLTITSVENETVTISGGTQLKNLRWSKYKGAVWQTWVGPDLIFDQLFVNRRLQYMARYPDYDPAARFLGGTAADAVSRERAARWKNPAGGYVHALHRSEWGDFHYVIKGKDSLGELILEGGWQNNRRMGMHPVHRFVENIFEELDTAGEWYYDKQTGVLYYYPSDGLDIMTATFETPRTRHLIEFNGTEATPVKNIRISGLTLMYTLRTFMENKEPLLRSDWTIYRGGAVLFNGAVNCGISDCVIRDLGGNAVFFNNYNRYCEVSGCLISGIGASAVCFVGDPAAVRSPGFEYNEIVPLEEIDRSPGPKTSNYPASCVVYNNLMFNLGTVEKQSAGIELSMCRRITASHNTIYDVPRAGINVSEGTWGGHEIAYNDVFNTVKESGDHGSFNSWGRDRYWHPDKKKLDSIVATNFDLALLDVVEPIFLHNNRMRCDHGWDIDLDDGSSNYLIYNNLCLNGGIKLREGVNRVVDNNIMVNNTFHPHVWFKNSNDVFVHNVVATGYLPIGIHEWGKEIDYNVFPDSASLKAAWERGTDKHSVCEPLVFQDPQQGDFRLKDGSKAFETGFKNFPMDSFGVVSPKLKMLAKKIPLPVIVAVNKTGEDEAIEFMGARVKTLRTLGERSATGMDETRGVLVVSVMPGTAAAKFLQPNDVILFLNGKRIDNVGDLTEARMRVIGTSTGITIFRNQKDLRKDIDLEDNK